MARKITTEIWISELPEKHTLKYGYKDSVYRSTKELVEITCPIHGNFWQRAGVHSRGAGCNACAVAKAGDTQRLTTEQWVANAALQWGDLYDHSLVEYRSAVQKVDIICKVHGLFSILPSNHVNGARSQGCPVCADLVRAHKAEKSRSTQEYFLGKCFEEHGDKYGYSKAEYKGDKVKVTITCPIHGDFKQTPNNHYHGQGCPKCKKNGYQVTKPGSLYVLSNGDITKVGITNRSVSTRNKEITRLGGPELNIESDHWFADGSIPLRIEGIVHKYLREKYEPITDEFNGSTECFYDVDLQALTDFIVPLALYPLAATSETNNRPNIN